MLNRSMSLIVAIFATISFSGASYAGVIYNWETVSNSSTIDSVVGQIEVTDDAWLSGNLNTRLDNFGIGGSPFPASPLLSFNVTVNGKSLRIVPRNPLDNNFGGEFLLDASLRFDGANPASGSIIANNSESDIDFGGNPLWEIARFGSDDADTVGQACFEAPGCSGAIGLWQIDASTIPNPRVTVAEPSTYLLFLGALAMIIGAGASKRTRNTI